MAGKINLPHVCPSCKKEARTYQELEAKFGFRNLNSESATNQSWCRDCRKQK